MTYSKSDDSAITAITRVLQQEVFSQLALNRSLPHKLILPNIKPALYIDIADVRVACYRLIIPDKLAKQLNSFKLNGLTFVSLDNVASSSSFDSSFRAGVPEIAQGFIDLKKVNNAQALYLWSNLNKKLALLPICTK